MSVLASPAYWPCPECGNSEFWVLTDGQIMCADWPHCGAIYTDVVTLMRRHEDARKGTTP